MGIDGTNCLEIRGSKEDLDILQVSGVAIDGDDEIKAIAERFFGSKQISILKRTKKYLVVGYEFRNYPVYEYLRALLEAYPKCWIKNTFQTETGACGLWVGRFQGGVPEIQESEWRELTHEEEEYDTDFSR